jgi:phosphatidylglycerol---prolipoprotein diacylglyceryl transferase
VAIQIDIDPVITRLGPLELRWYGVLMMSAVLVGAFAASREARRKGFDPAHVWNSLLLVLPLGILGARLVHVLDDFERYLRNPGDILGLQLVGLAIYGAVIGGILGAVLYARWQKLPVARFLDCAAIGLPLAQITGRFANIINADTWGSPTDLPWGFVYTHPSTMLPRDLLGVATHPTPVYEQLWLAFALLLILPARRHLRADGSAIMLYLALYSLGRFFVSIFRVNIPLLLGLKQAQLIALAAILVLVPVIVLRERRARRRDRARSRPRRRRKPRRAG